MCNRPVMRHDVVCRPERCADARRNGLLPTREVKVACFAAHAHRLQALLHQADGEHRVEKIGGHGNSVFVPHTNLGMVATTNWTNYFGSNGKVKTHSTYRTLDQLLAHFLDLSNTSRNLSVFPAQNGHVHTSPVRFQPKFFATSSVTPDLIVC